MMTAVVSSEDSDVIYSVNDNNLKSMNKTLF